MNAKNTATTTKSRITKRIGQLAIAAVAATALALGSAPSAQALTGREAFDKLPSSCRPEVTDNGPEFGYMVEFFCPGPPPVHVSCINKEPCKIINRVVKSGVYEAKAPTGQVTATGPANSVGTTAVQSNDALAASTDAILRQLFAQKTAVTVKAPIAGTTEQKSAPTVR
jgi:hypothetical protein